MTKMAHHEICGICHSSAACEHTMSALMEGLKRVGEQIGMPTKHRYIPRSDACVVCGDALELPPPARCEGCPDPEDVPEEDLFIKPEHYLMTPEDVRHEAVLAFVVHDDKRGLMVCQCCQGIGMGSASVIHEAGCAFMLWSDKWPGDWKLLRRSV